MIVSKKSIGLIILLFMPCFAVGQNCVDSTAGKQETIKTDSLCQRNNMYNRDTVGKDSCQRQHRLSFARKEQRQTPGINPNAVKMQNPDPYKKKFADMRIMETVGSHISR